jgi:hypothetical protein
MVTRKLSNKFQQTEKPVKDKNGNPLTTAEDQLKRWVEHFGGLLNRPTSETQPNIQPADTNLAINCYKPKNSDIRRAVTKLKV